MRIINENLVEILKIVSEVTGISIEDIKGRSKDGEIVVARHFYMFFGYLKTKCTYAEVGRSVDRDHSTVHYAFKKLKDFEFLTDTEKQIYRAISKKITKVLYKKINARDLIEEERKKIIQSRDIINSLMGRC